MSNVVTDVPEKEWQDFVESAGGDLWYTPQWSRFLEQTFGYPRYHLFATGPDGAVTGFLPLFRVTGPLTGDRLVSAPFTPRCGPLASGDAGQSLLAAACGLRDRLGTTSLEIHEKVDLPQFRAFHWYSTHSLDLTPGPEAIRGHIVNKNTRREITRSEQFGVEVVRSREPADIETFYQLNVRNKKDLGVLCHPRRFLQNLFSLLPGMATLYLARHDGQVLAASIFLRFRDRVMYGYAASTPLSGDFHATKRILWECILDSSAMGNRLLDFGRVSIDNAGLIRWRRDWGVEEEPLYYSHYPAPTGSMYHTRDTLPYRLGCIAIRALPESLYARLSERTFGSFG